MLIKRLLIGAIIRAAQNPAVQRKAGEIAGKALDKARPSMLRASQRAGELTREVANKIKNPTKGR